jgi:hypothetical protein
MHLDVAGRSDSKPYLIALDGQDLNGDVIADRECFANFPRQYQHFPTLLSLKRISLHGPFLPINAQAENQSCPSRLPEKLAGNVLHSIEKRRCGAGL